jgi:hypothetical protein
MYNIQFQWHISECFPTFIVVFILGKNTDMASTQNITYDHYNQRITTAWHLKFVWWQVTNSSTIGVGINKKIKKSKAVPLQAMEVLGMRGFDPTHSQPRH